VYSFCLSQKVYLKQNAILVWQQPHRSCISHDSWCVIVSNVWCNLFSFCSAVPQDQEVSLYLSLYMCMYTRICMCVCVHTTYPMCVIGCTIYVCVNTLWGPLSKSLNHPFLRKYHPLSLSDTWLYMKMFSGKNVITKSDALVVSLLLLFQNSICNMILLFGTYICDIFCRGRTATIAIKTFIMITSGWGIQNYFEFVFFNFSILNTHCVKLVSGKYKVCLIHSGEFKVTHDKRAE
jgi:hypothetical protein